MSSDGILCQVTCIAELHVSSNEAIVLIADLYQIGSAQFMREWYDRMPDISSMWFLDLTLKKIKAHANTEIVSE